MAVTGLVCKIREDATIFVRRAHHTRHSGWGSREMDNLSADAEISTKTMFYEDGTLDVVGPFFLT